jgi:hypothetical protein
MRKRIVASGREGNEPAVDSWLPLDELADVEITSEDARHPIEAALLRERGEGWRAAEPGAQTIRLIFAHPQSLKRVRLDFVELDSDRTQEYVVRWSPDGGRSFREIVRQQWNFSRAGATSETEDHRVDLSAVNVLEITIVPDISGGAAVASLTQLRLA